MGVFVNFEAAMSFQNFWIYPKGVPVYVSSKNWEIYGVVSKAPKAFGSRLLKPRGLKNRSSEYNA